jgi:hypothetical protein
MNFATRADPLRPAAEAVSPGQRQGDFFAIDQRTWAQTCKLNINCMTAYLVLARGTGHDQP